MDWINKIHQGDVLKVLKQMPDEFVDMAITSPPYYSLRDYKIDGQIGLEEHPQLFINKLVEIFHELKRVLKKTGSFYLNLGDTFMGGNLCAGMSPDYKSLSTIHKEKYNSKKFNEAIKKRNKLRSNWLQPKQLLMVPYRTAISMQEDGWILRNIIIWKKISPMPSSVTDRYNTSYEPIFFFVKSRKYFFDLDSIREPYKPSSVQRYNYPVGHIRTNAVGLKEIDGYHCDQDVNLNPLGKIPNDFIEYSDSKYSSKEEEAKHRQGFSKDRNEFEQNPLGKNPGDFAESWSDIFYVHTSSYKGAHFAVYSPKLLMKPIKSSCPQFVCKKCGRPREKIIITEGSRTPEEEAKLKELIEERGIPRQTAGILVPSHSKIIGEKWEECKCNAGFEPGIVLDPFMGSGTTAVVAKEIGRRYIGIELNPKYIEMAKKRIAKYTVIHNYVSETDQDKNELIDNDGLDWSI